MKTLYTPTQKQIYIWNIVGSTLNALLSVLLLMVASLLLNNRETDIFSLAWSFGMQALTVGTFQVRLYQSTDTNEKYSFNQYFIFRIITTLAMVLYSAGYVIISGYSNYKAIIVFLICLARTVDGFSDLFQGWFQQKERMDLSGKALSAHSLTLLFVFAPVLFITENLMLTSILMCVGNIITFFLFDYRYFAMMKKEHKTTAAHPSKNFLIKLASASLPLFINAYIIMDIFNQPKFSIDLAIGSGLLADGSQKIYNILFLPASVLNLIFLMFRPLITQMAVVWNKNERKEFLKIIKNISLGLLGMSVIVLIGGWFLGCPVLSFVYSTPLSDYRIVLIIAIIGGLFNTFMYLMDNAITVIRCHSFLIIAYAVAWIYTILTVKFFVNNYGLLGASICFASSMLLLFICTVIIFFICMHTKRSQNGQNN